MSGWVPCSAEAVQSAAASAATAFLAGFLLARAAPSRFGWTELLARCAAASLVAAAAATVCLVVPRFLIVFGAAAWLNALRSAVRNLDISLLTAAIPAACMAFAKTTLLLRARSSRPWIAADLAATGVLAVASAALDRLVWQVRTGLDPGSGLADSLHDQRVRAAVLCLPLASSGWAWASAALAHQPECQRRCLLGGAAATAAGLWGGLFVPF